MIAFTPPQSPHTLATFQIECAACKELITLAEGNQNASPMHPSWQHASTTQPFIWLRYVPQRFLKASQPQHRPHTFITETPQNLAADQQEAKKAIPINCPRCGADNRNWVLIQQTTRLRNFGRNFPFALLGVLTTLAILAYAPNHQPNTFKTGQEVLFYIALATVGLLSSLLLPIGWRAEREYWNAHSLLPRQSLFSPALQKAFWLLIFFVFVLPGFTFVAMPLAINYMEELLPSPTVEENLIGQENGESQAEEADSADSLAAIKPALKTWFRYTLATSLLTSLFGWVAVTMYVSEVNRHLPRPLYFSLADMTRVVSWEVKRVLDLPGDMNLMEWLAAERNELGGLDLLGIVRGTPEVDEMGKPLSQFVQARRYEVMTDPWGRIVYTEARDIQVPAGTAPAGEIGLQSPATSDEVHTTLDHLFRPQSRYIAL